jgi:hypothetical protein
MSQNRTQGRGQSSSRQSGPQGNRQEGNNNQGFKSRMCKVSMLLCCVRGFFFFERKKKTFSGLSYPVVFSFMSLGSVARALLAISLTILMR